MAVAPVRPLVSGLAASTTGGKTKRPSRSRNGLTKRTRVEPLLLLAKGHRFFQCLALCQLLLCHLASSRVVAVSIWCAGTNDTGALLTPIILQGKFRGRKRRGHPEPEVASPLESFPACYFLRVFADESFLAFFKAFFAIPDPPGARPSFRGAGADSVGAFLAPIIPHCKDWRAGLLKGKGCRRGEDDSLLGVWGRSETQTRSEERFCLPFPGACRPGRRLRANELRARLRLAQRGHGNQALRGCQFLALLENGSGLCHWKASRSWLSPRAPHRTMEVKSIFRAKRAGIHEFFPARKSSTCGPAGWSR